MRMLTQQIIILLLVWRSVRAIEDEKPPPEEGLDQISTASENLGVSLRKGESYSKSVEGSPSRTKVEPVKEPTTIHFENSNGFVPLESSDQMTAESEGVQEVETSDNGGGTVGGELENDPAYSTEARMLLNLAGPNADRRSFDGSDGQSGFEILKVNDETPAVANYHEFYENMQSNINKNRAANQYQSQDSARDQNKRTKERLKKIEKYLTNIHSNDPNHPFQKWIPSDYSGVPAQLTATKETFEPEKVVQPSHSANAMTNFHGYGESPRPRASSTSLRSHEDSRPKFTSSQKPRRSKPVVVIEPNDYKVDTKYGHTTARNSGGDHHRKHRKEVQQDVDSAYDADEREPFQTNRDDRYDQELDDRSSEEYVEVTEKPRKVHKNRKRPHSTESSRRLPKEHRGHLTIEVQSESESRKQSSGRAKLHRAKAKPSYWIEEDDEMSEENSQESTGPEQHTDLKNQEDSSRGKGNWNQAGPNIEVSHSNGFEVEEKPKFLVPVDVKLLPLTNFDHSTALGRSQAFDFTNVPNFVTGTPIVSSPAGQMSSSQPINSVVNSNAPNKSPGNPLNGNYGLSTPVPDIVVGQNPYQNQLQAVIVPQLGNKFASNLRPQYSPSTISPIFAVTQTLSPQNIAPTLNTPRSTPSPRTNQNLHHLSVTPVTPAVPHLLLPQPTLQTLLHSPYHANSNYNILVNPNGLHGQNVIQHGNGQFGNSVSTTTTPQPHIQHAHHPEAHIKKSHSHSNGQYVTTASFSVGNEVQQPTPATEKQFYLGNRNTPENQIGRTNSQEPYDSYREEKNPERYKTYLHTAQIVPAIISHPGNPIPMNYNAENFANLGGHLQEQQSILTPNIAPQPRDQNQQILRAANDIFVNTWRQLQQLQTNNDPRKMTYQPTGYGANDNLGSMSNTNANTANSLTGMNSVKAHLPILSAQNVEIANPNIKPSPIDISVMNHYDTVHHYPAAVLTTPIPLFSTTANFLAPRPVIATPSTINLQHYVDQLTHIGSHGNHVNHFEPRPDDVRNPENQHQPFNPIHFVPNIDLVKSQSMLNSKQTDTLPHQLNLVPVIPGGNFFKNTPGAQTELVHKPRLSSDLEKYADEMFKESLKTIYSTHKWNNDRRLQGNYSATELNELARLKSELQKFKASSPDPKYHNNDVLEAHHSETKVRTAQPGRTNKKPELSISDIEHLFKSDFKLSVPSDSAYNKNRPHSRPSSEYSKEVTELTDYLTPPKINSFVSKSPFIDAAKPAKKRPGNRPSGHSRPLPRPSPLVSRLAASSPEASASNRHESHHRHEKKRPVHYSHEHEFKDHRNYPTFTTTSAPDNDHYKTSSSEQYSKTDYYDINHPRMHNLLGLLMKNKQLPRGSPQSFFRDDDELRQYFDNEQRRMHAQFHDDKTMNFQKKSDTPINMGPPPDPRYHRTSAGTSS